MSRARQRADRIREEIPITQVLADYGYTIHADYGGEQQFSCDLHGDGSDSKPSARVYPDSNSAYCFACDRTRDAIGYVQEKEGKSFWDAVKALESRYGLGGMEYEDDGEGWSQKAPEAGLGAAITEITTTTEPFDKVAKRTRTFLDSLTSGKDLPLGAITRLWEAYDKIMYYRDKDLLPEDKGKIGMEKIRLRAFEKLKELAEAGP